MLRKWWLMLAALALVLSATTAARAQDTTTLKLGTLAPQDSPWGQVFKVWARNVDQKSNGALALDWSWGGSAGDESQMVNSMKSNQLDGAAITAVGLGQIFQDALIFQMPGLFSSWDKLTAARTAAQGGLNQGFEAAGFKALGWGDVGAAKMMSNGFAIKVPDDLKLPQAKTVYITGDVIGREFLRRVGVAATSISVPEIFPQLQQGNVTVINAPPLAANQLQWSSNLTHINTMTTGYGVGALVFAKSRFDQLPADAKQVLADTGLDAATRLTSRIRGLDAAAFAYLKQNKTAYEPSDAEKATWSALFLQTRQGLRGNPFNAALFDTISAAGQ